MKHLCISDFGTFIGVSGERAVIKKQNEVLKEYPLKRLCSITIGKRGVSLSSDFISAASARGIKIFFTDRFGHIYTSISGTHSHAVVRVREHQLLNRNGEIGKELARRVIYGKLRNQRAVIGYFGKIARQQGGDETILSYAFEKLKEFCEKIVKADSIHWRNMFVGIEGEGASIYFDALFRTGLLNCPEKRRVKRNASDSVNSALNYGYAILRSYVWNSIINAGLEPYAGFLHTDRPGKPSLVLDLMEEYRAWVVDRTVIKNRHLTAKKRTLDGHLKSVISRGVQETFAKKYLYHKKKLTLETILQRQVYRAAGAFRDEKTYKPYIFKW